MISFASILLSAGYLLINTPSALANTQPSSNCRCIPGDKCWPSQQKWANLNTTVHGRLIAAAPLARVCHAPNYNEAECTALGEVWAKPETHYPNPVEIMAPEWQNYTCDPFTSKSTPCNLGNYVDYTINISSVADITAGLKFAQQNNVRLVIKNTGHDYLGKSTGKGALGLWTHNLKSIDFLQYSSPGYTGQAVKFAAGVQAFELYPAVAAKGLHIVGGECASVGLAGGFLQGGGHSTLTSTYGLGADQILEWEAVTTNGTHLIASPTQNKDLYWALSGGGGGTYAVVVSVTVKAYKDGVVGGALIQWNKTSDNDENFWKGIEAFHTALPGLVDSGATALYSLTNDSFTVVPVTSPGSTAQQMNALLQPFQAKMKALNISVALTITSFPTFLEHFNYYLGPLPTGLPVVNIIDVTLSGRLIPRRVVQNATSNAGLIDALKLSVRPGGGFVTGGVAINAAHSVAKNNAASNAVLPAWRDAIVTILAFSPWDYKGTLASNNEAQDYTLDVTIPALKALAPDGGAYLNEANRLQPDWKEAFYGVNYDRLRAIKKVYDPNDLFYGNTAVGSEAWVPDSDGRLCRA
ncbi:FAD binding domain protein [Hypoxylon argillaceum]|nr:FAD binding domain protein [Hypoxylon argillaceum]